MIRVHLRAIAILALTALGTPLDAQCYQNGALCGALTATDIPNKASVIDLANCAGVTWGINQTTAVRQANATAINICLAQLGSRKSALWPAATLEVQGGTTLSYTANSVAQTIKAGIVIPPGTVSVIGVPKSSRIVQYDPDSAALTIGGDPTTLFSGYVSGLTVGMGVTGNSGSRCVWRGTMAFSHLVDIDCDRYAALDGAGGVHHPYIGVDDLPGGSEFSNHFDRWFVSGGQASFWNDSDNGTGSVHTDIHMGGGGSTDRTTLSGAALVITSGLQGVWNQLNIEWITGSQAIAVNNNTGTVFNSTHIEGFNQTGYSQPFINNAISQLTFNGLVFYDDAILAANGETGTPSLFGSYGIAGTTVRALDVKFQSLGSGAYGGVDTAFLLYNPTYSSTIGSGAGTFDLTDARFESGAGTAIPISLDASLPAATYGALASIGRYVWRPGQSSTERAQIPVGDAALTLYGVHKDAVVMYTAPLTANRQVTIAANMAASGALAQIPRAKDDQPSLYRNASATGSFTAQFARSDGAVIGTALTAASTGYTLDPQLIADDNNNQVASLGDANQTLYGQGYGHIIMAPTTTRTITLSPQISASVTTASPLGTCKSIANAAGSAGSLSVTGTGMSAVTLAANTAGTFCTVNSSGSVARVQ